MIKIAVVAIAPTMFEYRRPTSCYRQWPAIRPDRNENIVILRINLSITSGGLSTGLRPAG